MSSLILLFEFHFVSLLPEYLFIQITIDSDTLTEWVLIQDCHEVLIEVHGD